MECENVTFMDVERRSGGGGGGIDIKEGLCVNGREIRVVNVTYERCKSIGGYGGGVSVSVGSGGVFYGVNGRYKGCESGEGWYGGGMYVEVKSGDGVVDIGGSVFEGGGGRREGEYVYVVCVECGKEKKKRWKEERRRGECMWEGEERIYGVVDGRM